MFKGIFYLMILGWSLDSSWCLDICNDQEEGARLAHPADCSRFIICRGGVTAQIRYCPFGLHYNRFDDICDLQYRAGCYSGRMSRLELDYEDPNTIDCDACRALCPLGKPPGSQPEIPPGNKPCNKPTTTPCPTRPTPKPTTTCRSTRPPPTTTCRSTRPPPTTTCRSTKPPPATTSCRPTRPPTTTPCRPPKPPTPPTPAPTTKPCRPTKPQTPPTTTPCRPTMPPTTTPCRPPKPPTPPTPPPTKKPCRPPTGNPDPESPQTGPSGLTCADRGKCEGKRDGILFADDSSTGYIVCQCQCEILMPCPAGLIFNEAKQTCDWPQS